MEAVKVRQVIAKDGEVLVTGLPYRKGQAVQIIVLPQPTTLPPRERLTVGRLRKSGLIGLWHDRDDIGDSSAGKAWMGAVEAASIARAKERGEAQNAAVGR